MKDINKIPTIENRSKRGDNKDTQELYDKLCPHIQGIVVCNSNARTLSCLYVISGFAIPVLLIIAMQYC